MREQILYYDTEAGEIRTTVFDGSIPLEGALRRRAGVAVPHPSGEGYRLFTVDGQVHDQDDQGRPFLTKRAVDAFEEAYVQRVILRQDSQTLPGISAEALR